MSRYGLSVAEVQEVIEAAIGGKEAGHAFRRRPPLSARRASAGEICAPISTRCAASRFRCPKREEDEDRRIMPSRRESRAHRGRQPSSRSSEVADFEVEPGPNQISRENGKRRIVVTCQRARTRHRRLRHRSAAEDRDRGENSRRLLDRVGRAVRATSIRDEAAADRRARRAAAHLRSCSSWPSAA